MNFLTKDHERFWTNPKKIQGLENVTTVEQRNIKSVNVKHINQWRRCKTKMDNFAT